MYIGMITSVGRTEVTALGDEAVARFDELTAMLRPDPTRP